LSTQDGLSPLRDIIRDLGLTARKSLGQNFLLDFNLTRRIARAAGPLEGATIVEVGPGPGGLTRALLMEGASRVIAIEKDERCLPALAAIEAALKKTVNVWINGVDLALGEFNKLDHLPSGIYLCGGGSSLDLLMETLQKSDWYKKLPFTRKPVVKHIQPEQVSGIVDNTGKVNDHTFITAMGLLRVGLDTMQFSGNGSGSIREKIDRMLRV